MRTILIADDESAIRVVNKRWLERAGYTESNGFRYVEADGGETAWNLYLEQKPELMILDDIMNDSVRGSVVAKRVREGYEGSTPDPNTYIISASGTANSEDLPQGVGLLRKPFDPSDLVSLVNGYLGNPNISEQETQQIIVPNLPKP